MDDARIGPYVLGPLLGVGGMGEVYRAHDTRRDRDVALKLLPESLAHDAEYVARFRRESHAAARLIEPHVIPIHDYGEIDGRLFIDMRLVEGVTARDLLAAEGRLEPGRAVDLVGQVSDALGAAHDDNLVHRDIKPSNVLVTPSDFAYVVDFGIARMIGAAQPSLTITGVTVGTLDYMAPERFMGGDVDGRSDLYSLACVAYELLTGRQPFGGDDLPSLMYAHLYTEPPRAADTVHDLPPAVDAVLARGMAKSAADRYPDTRSFDTALRAALVAGAPPVPPPRSGEAARETVSRPVPIVPAAGADVAPPGAGDSPPVAGAAAPPAGDGTAAAPSAGDGTAAGNGTAAARKAGAAAPDAGGVAPDAGAAGGAGPESAADAAAPETGPGGGAPQTGAGAAAPVGEPVAAASQAGAGAAAHAGAAAPASAVDTDRDGRRRGGVVVRPRMLWLTGAVVVAVLLLAVGSLTGLVGPASLEFRLEPVGTTGPNPFLTTPAGTDRSGVTTPPGATGPVPGDTPGLYAATPDRSACDVTRIVSDLRADPRRATAWAAVQRIPIIDITTWLTGQNPVTLRADAMATEHRYVEGRANAEPVVLQAGTAVLVDQHGTPVVKCRNGNPLAPPPTRQADPPTFSGTAWPGFTATRITIVARSAAPLSAIVVLDPTTDRTTPVPRPEPAPGPGCRPSADGWTCPPMPDPSRPPAPGCTVDGERWSCPVTDPSRPPSATCTRVGDRWSCTPEPTTPPRADCRRSGGDWICPRSAAATASGGATAFAPDRSTPGGAGPDCATGTGGTAQEPCPRPPDGAILPDVRSGAPGGPAPGSQGNGDTSAPPDTSGGSGGSGEEPGPEAPVPEPEPAPEPGTGPPTSPDTGSPDTSGTSTPPSGPTGSGPTTGG